MLRLCHNLLQRLTSLRRKSILSAVYGLPTENLAGCNVAMQRERVADDIYVFTSEVYAQVTAGAVITSEGAILIDTLVFPEETRSIRNFIEGRLGCPVRYVINTHYHADHTYGTCFFPGAVVVAHALCYNLLDTRGRVGLEQAKTSMPELS